MGNSNSTQAPPLASADRNHARRTQPSNAALASSATPRAHTPHRSLRTKKKSLELPDLASLSLSPAPSSLNASPHAHYGRHKPSSPIPIPISPHTAVLDNHVQSSVYGRPHPTQLPSTSHIPDVLLAPPSTHIPIAPNQRPHSPYAPYNSSRSPSRGRPPPPPPPSEIPDDPPPFVTETIRSTIPLGITKPLSSTGASLVHKPTDHSRDLVPVKITWHGPAKTVVLARAGDANWTGRQPMERECVSATLLHILTI